VGDFFANCKLELISGQFRTSEEAHTNRRKIQHVSGKDVANEDFNNFDLIFIATDFLGSGIQL
jgi:siroheme synthase (precorrin-2 oxidase/ferrochelatase)